MYQSVAPLARHPTNSNGVIVYDLAQDPGPLLQLSAEEIGRAIVQNIVMLGFFTAATEIVPLKAMREGVAESVPAGTEELNLRAFDAGFEAFQESYGSGAEKKIEVAPVGN